MGVNTYRQPGVDPELARRDSSGDLTRRLGRLGERPNWNCFLYCSNTLTANGRAEMSYGGGPVKTTFRKP
jgi:hypothetical protein